MRKPRLLADGAVSLFGSAAVGSTKPPKDLRECTGTHNPFPGHRDDDAHAHTDNAYVKRVLATSRHRFKKQFAGLASLRLERRNAEVWTPDASGTPVRTGTIPDYWIVVQLRARRDCARGPWFWSGVPLEFVAPG